MGPSTVRPELETCSARGVLCPLAEFGFADHWALAVPIARTHTTIGSLFVTRNAYPREALVEALMRFVEEDLSASPE